MTCQNWVKLLEIYIHISKAIPWDVQANKSNFVKIELWQISHANGNTHVNPAKDKIIAVPYIAKLWWWKSLTKFDKSSMSESLTSKTLTNRVRFLFTLLKNKYYCRIITLSWGFRNVFIFPVCGFHIYKDMWEPTIAVASFI